MGGSAVGSPAGGTSSLGYLGLLRQFKSSPLRQSQCMLYSTRASCQSDGRYLSSILFSHGFVASSFCSRTGYSRESSRLGAF